MPYVLHFARLQYVFTQSRTVYFKNILIHGIVSVRTRNLVLPTAPLSKVRVRTRDIQLTVAMPGPRMAVQPRSSTLLAEYMQVTGNEDPGPRFRNDPAWLTKKIQEFQAPPPPKKVPKVAQTLEAKYADMRRESVHWIGETEPMIAKLQRLEQRTPKLGHEIGTKAQQIKANETRALKAEVERDRVYDVYKETARNNPYCKMLQDHAISMGMDSHGKQFIEALEALTQKMKAAEALYDQEDEVLACKRRKRRWRKANTSTTSCWPRRRLRGAPPPQPHRPPCRVLLRHRQPRHHSPRADARASQESAPWMTRRRSSTPPPARIEQKGGLTEEQRRLMADNH
eukprot:SAG22_NODE_2849_length_2159_cov_7.006311_3_plen_341_part_00